MLFSTRVKKTNRLLGFAVCLILMLLMLLPAAVSARETEKTVRVGWHEEPYFIIDQYGRRSGYSYEYQWKLTAYNGWNYEYVEGTWSELLQKLKNGEIDLMSNISYTDERAKEMLYASLPMGTESYYIFVSPDNTEIRADDYSTLNGKRVGVTKDSFQRDLFVEWAEKHGIDAEIVELTTTDEESRSLLGSEFDAFVTLDVYGDPEVTVPVCKIGSSEFYFAVSKDRPDLLPELDAAMNRIQDENKYFNQQLHEKYLNSSQTEQYLTPEEQQWLSEHGTLRVGYQDNYLAFCAADESTGGLTGALKDFLSYASTSLKNTQIEFEAIAYPTAVEAIEAMKKGEVDCIFPVNLSDYDCETIGIFMAPVLMRTEMDAVVRSAEQKEFILKEKVAVAINEGNTNYEMFLADHFPEWNRVYYPDTPTALEAVAKGEADCVLISNYRYGNISKQCEKLHLSTVYTGVDMDYSFAVNKDETMLYSILSRVTRAVPGAVIHTALNYYSTEDVKSTFGDLIKDNLLIILIFIGVVILVILLLLLRSIQAQRKMREEEHIVKDLNQRVFVDALTSVRNKAACSEYLQDIEERIKKAEAVELAIAIFDCDDLKVINDSYGHDKGDIYLKTASRLICRIFQHSPVFRIGGDEFEVILQHEDYRNREALAEQFEKEQITLSEAAQNSWEEVHMALGIAVYDPQLDQDITDTIRRADKVMYENKRIGKEKRNAQTLQNSGFSSGR